MDNIFKELVDEFDDNFENISEILMELSASIMALATIFGQILVDKKIITEDEFSKYFTTENLEEVKSKILEKLKSE